MSECAHALQSNPQPSGPVRNIDGHAAHFDQLSAMRRVLVWIIVAFIVADVIWWRVGHFDVDMKSLGAILSLAFAPLALAIVYSTVRKDEQVAMVATGIAFLGFLAPLGTMLSYFALSIAGPEIDWFWAAIDRSIGFYWPAVFRFAVLHPLLYFVLAKAYMLSVFMTAIAVALLGFPRDFEGIWKLCVATAIVVVITIAFWTALPSFGAYVVYEIPHRIGASILSSQIPDHLKEMYRYGPGRIEPGSSSGVIGFPSFHTEELLLSLWYLRRHANLFVPMLVFGVIALVSVPVIGGHHLVDMFGGAAVSAMAIMLTRFAYAAVTATPEGHWPGGFSSVA